MTEVGGGQRVDGTDRLGRGLFGFLGGLTTFGLLCCGGLALVLGATAGTAVTNALAGPLRWPVAMALLALAGRLMLFVVRTERPCVHSGASDPDVTEAFARHGSRARRSDGALHMCIRVTRIGRQRPRREEGTNDDLDR